MAQKLRIMKDLLFVVVIIVGNYLIEPYFNPLVEKCLSTHESPHVTEFVQIDPSRSFTFPHRFSVTWQAGSSNRVHY